MPKVDIMSMILTRLKNLGAFVPFLFRNTRLARDLPVFPETTFESLVVRPCTSLLVSRTSDLYSTLNNGRPLCLRNRVHLTTCGSRYCLVVCKADGRAIGMVLYYFNARDQCERTIHEAFIGILPDHRGRGLATRIRRLALEHFANVSWLAGVSSRVSLDNVPSLTSNLHLGFKPTAEYVDKATGERRYYLVCSLEHYRPPRIALATSRKNGD